MSITRARYRERQCLAAADLRVEQEYRLGMAGRHHLAPHDWGVIRGLRVLQLDGEKFLLTLGIAIDGYGRELLVPAPTQFVIDGYDEDKCWFVQIHYCEDPEQVPPGRACQDVPAPRIRQRTQIRVTETFFPPDSATELATARAAGVIADALPWPILVARVGKGCPGATRTSPLIDYSQVPYARHRAASIRSPTGNTKLQLGLAGLTDVYQFLLSTRDAKRQLEKRVGIDRDGTVHVWRPLMISGADGLAAADIGHGLQLQISMPMPAGLGHTLQIQGQIDAELKTLTASLVQLGPTPLGGPFSISGQTTLALQSATLPFAHVHSASVSLLDVLDRTKAPQSIRFADGRKRLRRAIDRLHAHAVAAGAAQPPALPAVSFSAQISATGGLLAPDAVLLRPAAKLDAEPLFREIHTVVTSADTDPVPKTELRISGGGADDSDASGRVSVGARTTKGYLSALRMDGGGRLRMLRGPDVDTPELLLDVHGTAYLPPIGKNDPMLPDLLTLAFIAGLFQIGSVATNPTLELSESSSADGIYDLKITSNPANYTIKRTLELIFGNESAGPADMSLRALDDITVPSGANQSVTKTIPVPGLAPPHRKIRIVVLMLVESSNKTRVVVSKALALEIPA